MIIYVDDASNEIRANYFDTEGHQINYKVTPSVDAQNATFISEVIRKAEGWEVERQVRDRAARTTRRIQNLHTVDFNQQRTFEALNIIGQWSNS